MQQPKLVIFDCDGVLVDTETIANEIFSQQLAELGIEMSPEQCHRKFTGKTMERCFEEVQQLTDQELPDDWADKVRASDIEAFKAGVDAIPGVEAVIQQLQSANLPFCVGSSGRYEKMNVTLGASKLIKYFEKRLFSAQDCKNGKPAPDIFLYAAFSMGNKPEDCVVIEDSYPGVEAGVAAGMKVFAYCADPMTDQNRMRDLGGIPFTDMAELPLLLGLKADEGVQSDSSE
ncbi:HAD family hydrolase [Polycladidibacter stylochi]|uniref:HAD family hydrolase n=1 Tax=Polycladidibacter stylochi TaxID=1807766 RepID=UPI000834E5E6|nr:HAD family phosphatase [Pseudovibrio stylochi]